MSLSCPTWFHVSSEGLYCECGSSLSMAIDCDNVTQTVSLAVGYSMTLSNISGKLQQVVGDTNNAHLVESRRGFIFPPKNVSLLNDFMCTTSKRRGLLCSDCISGYGFAPNSYNKESSKCNTNYAVAVFLVLGVLPITVSFMLIIVFHLDFPSGFLLSYIIYCHTKIVFLKQFYGIFYVMERSMGSFGQHWFRISIILSGMPYYFLGIYYASKPTCMHHTLSKLHVLCLEYVFCLYPLLLLFVGLFCVHLHAKNFRLIVYLSNMFHRLCPCIKNKINISDSFIHAYATFYFLSFLYIVFLSYSILFPLYVYNINGKLIKTVLVYDKSIEYLSTGHLYYAIPAILLFSLLGFLPTVILCFQTTKQLKKCCRIRPRTQLMLNTFVETFSSCYKDGLNGSYDYRFLSPVPMIASFMLFLFFPLNSYQYRIYTMLLFSFSMMILAFIYAFLRPYKSMYMNFSAPFHMAVLSIQAVITFTWLDGRIIPERALASTYTTFSLLPHCIAICTIIYKFLYRFPLVSGKIDYICGIWLSYFHPKSGVVSSCSILPHRLQDSSAYRRRLLTNN